MACGTSSTELLFNDASHADLVQSLENIASVCDATSPPRAVVVVSSQWQAEEVLVTSADRPGFQQSYTEVVSEYGSLSCPLGAPDVAAQLLQLLEDGGVKCRADPTAQLMDAGIGPVALLFPGDDVPVVCVSLLASLDAKEHARIGELLQPLCWDDVFFLGVGLSSNPFPFLQVPGDPLILSATMAFKEELDLTVTGRKGRKVSDDLVRWESFPCARLNHATAEHLMPLLVVAAAAGSSTAAKFDTTFLGLPLSSYAFTSDSQQCSVNADAYNLVQAVQ